MTQEDLETRIAYLEAENHKLRNLIQALEDYWERESKRSGAV